MPNHIKNVITIKNLTLKEQRNVFSSMINKTGHFDFNLINNIPNCLNIDDGSYTDIGVALITSKVPQYHGNMSFENWKIDLFNEEHILKNMDKIIKLGKQAVYNKKTHGSYTWYEHNKKVWGTKWNAYNQDITGFVNSNKLTYQKTIYLKRILKKHLLKQDNIFIGFDTANSTPSPIWEKMSTLNPEVMFEIKYASEDIGAYCGVFTIQNGKIISRDILTSYQTMTYQERIKWTQFAFELHYPNTNRRKYGYDHNWEYSEETEEAYLEEIKVKKKIKFKLQQL